MPQADIMAKSIIIFLNVFSILLGLYSGFKFFKAYLDGKDIMKFKGYLINAFFLILIFPLLITVIGSKLAQLPSGQYAQIEIRVQTNDLRGVNDRISLSLKEYKIKPDEEHIIAFIGEELGGLSMHRSPDTGEVINENVYMQLSGDLWLYDGRLPENLTAMYRHFDAELGKLGR